MNCPKCLHLNEDDALFCSKCGYKFGQKQDWNSILVFAYCFSLLFWAITYFILPQVFDWAGISWQTANTIHAFFGIIASLLTFVLPFGIRITWMKIVAFIVIAIAAIINIIRNYNVIIESIN